MGLWVNKVVGNQMMTVVEMMIMMKMMKIVQDEKAWKKETRTPEWIRHPSIQVVIIPRRRIVGDYRRTLLVIIIFNFQRRNVFTACWRRSLCVLARRNNQTKLGIQPLECLQGLIFSHG
jgi:hypothetical protein